ncbi:hypothetical protein MMC22_003715 [Lobaria immixta]|nr:hypothetical protein [Lobaria immixta]
MTGERDYRLISRLAALRRILKLTASRDQLIPILFPSRDFALKTVHLERLLEAVDEGNWWEVSQIVDDNFELILIDERTFDMALRVAAMKRNGAIARLLVDKGADVNTHTSEGSSALNFALDEGNEKVLQVLLDKGANINSQERHVGFAFQKASASGDIDTV